MKYLLLILVVFSFASCEETKPKKTEVKVEHEVENVSEETAFTSYDTVHNLLKGSWSNAFEPNSVIVFKENTTTNMYQDIIASENVPYTLGTSCKNEAAVKSSDQFRFVTTLGNGTECYYINTLDKNTLILALEKEDILLTFKRVEKE